MAGRECQETTGRRGGKTAAARRASEPGRATCRIAAAFKARCEWGGIMVCEVHGSRAGPAESFGSGDLA
jgi:hypothetical protein